MRFLLRLIGLVFLAIAVVFAVGDIARSIANESTRLITIGEAAAAMNLSVEQLAGSSQTVGVAMHWSIAISCGVVGIVFLLLGRQQKMARRRRAV